jgi:hypothetical protein
MCRSFTGMEDYICIHLVDRVLLWCTVVPYATEPVCNKKKTIENISYKHCQMIPIAAWMTLFPLFEQERGLVQNDSSITSSNNLPV